LARHAAPPARPDLDPTTITTGVAALALSATTLTPMARAAAGTSRGLRSPVRLPVAVEALAPYVPQSTCDPTPKPGVVSFRDLVLRTYHRGQSLSITRPCGAGTSEHYEGRAWDWGVDLHDEQDVDAVNDLTRWLLFTKGRDGSLAVNARRLGIMYVIFNDRIWASYRADDGWRPYTGGDAHTNHVHFSFSWPGARGHTSFWTGQPATDASLATPSPKATPSKASRAVPARSAPARALAAYRGQVLRYGMRSAGIRSLQVALEVRPVTGYFGPVTLSAVRRFQAAHHLPATGTVGPLTWRALLPPAPPPSPTLVALRRNAGPVLTPGTRSPAVSAVQVALGVRPRSGYYGPLTREAVERFQARHRIPTTGNIGPLTWKALLASVH
jgi:hypothetical protein